MTLRETTSFLALLVFFFFFLFSFFSLWRFGFCRIPTRYPPIVLPSLSSLPSLFSPLHSASFLLLPLLPLLHPAASQLA
ncbi:hypothetical protein HDK64DRAFT_259451, partial [Phyllosticta capitalensis]